MKLYAAEASLTFVVDGESHDPNPFLRFQLQALLLANRFLGFDKTVGAPNIVSPDRIVAERDDLIDYLFFNTVWSDPAKRLDEERWDSLIKNKI